MFKACLCLRRWAWSFCPEQLCIKYGRLDKYLPGSKELHSYMFYDMDTCELLNQPFELVAPDVPQ